MEQLLQWLQDTSLGEAVRISDYLFPVFESIHVIAITATVGCIFMMDLRLAGLFWTNRPVCKVIGDNVKIVWITFAIAFISGFLLFMSHAVNYMHDPWFVWKFVLIGLAFVNQLVFHSVTCKDVLSWGPDYRVPISARAAAAISLALWLGIVACGRMIGFTMDL